MEQRCEKKLHKKLEKAINDRNYEEILNIRSELSERKQHAGNPDEAVLELKDLLDDLARDKNKLRVAKAHRLTGEAIICTEDARQAEKHFKKYLALSEEEDDKVEVQRAYASLARYYLCILQISESESEKQACYVKSIKVNHMALDLAVDLENKKKIPHREAAEMKSRLYMNIAIIYELEGKINEAERNALKAVEICRGGGCSSYDTAKCLRALSIIKSKLNHTEGLKLINEASNIAEMISDSMGRDLLLEILEAKAEMLLALGDFEQAKACLCTAYMLETSESKEQVKRYLKKVVYILNTQDKLRDIDEDDYVERKKLFEMMGDCSASLKAYSKAVGYYKKMLECSEKLNDDAKSKSAALGSIAITYGDLRMFEKAIEYYERERELWLHNPKQECRCRINLANLCEKRRDHDAQLENLRHARTLAESSQNQALQLEVLKLLHSYYKNHGGSQDDDIKSNLEDEIANLRNDVGSQEEDSQPMDVEEDEDVYESIDLSSLPELQPKESRESRTRQKRKLTMKKNEKGETRLHTACIKGDLTTVQFLLNQGHPVNVYDNSGWAPIHEAANHGHAEIVKLLIEKGAKINDQGRPGSLDCDGITPLYDAAGNGHFTVLELLLDMNAKVGLRTVKERWNALNSLDHYFAAHKEDLTEEETQRCGIIRERMVEALRKAGESVEAASSAEPEFILGTDNEYYRGSKSGTHLGQVKSRNVRVSSDENEAGPMTMKRRKDTQKILYSDDDDDEDLIETQPVSRSRRDSGSDNEAGPSHGRRGDRSFSSVSEYRSAMDSMKRRNMPTQPRAPARYNKSVSALVPEEKANEEWLEDDIGPSTSKSTLASSKRRHSSETRVESQKKRSKQKSRASIGSSSSSLEAVNLDAGPSFEEVEYTYVSPDSESSSEEDRPIHIEKPLPRISPVKRTPTKRHRIISSPEKSKTKQPSPKKLFPADESISVRAKIEGKILLVPISGRDISLGTLAEKIAERYMKMEGMEPKLTLTTSDGAIMSPEDPISVVLRPNETELEICAIVDALVLPPLSKRYKEACKLEKIVEDDHVLRCLEGSQATMELTFKNLPLCSQIAPIFKSIIKENSLQTINLSGCGIEDTGVEILSHALSFLENLQSLKLSCNYITSKGLDILSSKVEQTKCLKALRDLDLSSNMFGEDGFKSLAAFLDNLDLTSVNISDCDLEVPQTFTDIPFLALDSVEDLNVSHNALTCKGISYIFGRLNAWNLKKLDISYNSGSEDDDETSVAKELELLFLKVVASDEPGGVIKELNLSGCDLKDQDLWELLSSAHDKGIAIEHIKISCNPRLTDMCLQPLLNHTPQITEITATGCPSLYNQDSILSSQIKNLKICASLTDPPPFHGTVLQGPGGYLLMSQ